jgi:27-O-demethylrifamycin SV methyltransferase
MVDDTSSSHEPAAHYNRVHEAWRLIMGEEFHYGYFATPETPLDVATSALTGQMLDRAGITPGDRVLDVGCGTGRQSCDLAEKHGAVVLGITTSESGVASARALAEERGLADARFERRDGTDNRLPDGSFDVAWVLESSHLMRDRKALLSECARALAPGGRIVLCDIIRRREIPFLEVRARRDDLATLRAAFGDAHMHPLDSYTSTMEELGLTVTDSTDITLETLPTFAAWRANVELHEPALLELLEKDGVDDFVRSTHILETFWREGTLGYGILAAAKPS